MKGTIHWVSAVHAIKGDVRLYDPLFNRPDPGADGDFQDDINPDSLTINTAALLEPSLADASVGEAIQFERLGYFCADPDHSPNAPVFNRTIGLRDSWAKAQKKG